MSSSLLFQQCPACLVWMVLQMRSQWPCSCYFVGGFFQDLFSIARNILVQIPFSFFSICLVSIHVLHPYSRIDTTIAWKKLHFILLGSSNFYMINNLLITVNAFARRILMTFLVDEMLLHELVH